MTIDQEDQDHSGFFPTLAESWILSAGIACVFVSLDMLVAALNRGRGIGIRDGRFVLAQGSNVTGINQSLGLALYLVALGGWVLAVLAIALGWALKRSVGTLDVDRLRELQLIRCRVFVWPLYVGLALAALMFVVEMAGMFV